jgi:hypothetical protein
VFAVFVALVCHTVVCGWLGAGAGFSFFFVTSTTRTTPTTVTTSPLPLSSKVLLVVPNGQIAFITLFRTLLRQNKTLSRNPGQKTCSYRNVECFSKGAVAMWIQPNHHAHHDTHQCDSHHAPSFVYLVLSTLTHSLSRLTGNSLE